jgi:hypothetical protein
LEKSMTVVTDRQIRLENAELLRGLVASVESVRQEQQTMHSQVSEIRDKVITIEARDVGAQVAALALRVAALEVAYQRREGRDGMIGTVFKSPSFGWFVGFMVTIIAWATGKLEL